MQGCILTADIGTSAVKTALFSPDLTLLDCRRVEYQLDTRDGRVELDPEVYFDAFVRGVRQLPPELLSQVLAIGMTSQGETLIPVDKQGTPLHPAVVWLDGRAGREAALLQRELPIGAFYKTTGLTEINGALPLSKLLYFKTAMPELYGKTAFFLLPEDYLLFRLCGRFCTEKSIQCSTGYFSLPGDGWWTGALDAAGIDAAKLPELLEPGERAGGLTKEAATALGLTAGIPVCTGAMDQTSAAMAAGCTSPGQVTETTGTALVVAAYTDSPDYDAPHRTTVYRHVNRGAYLYLPVGNTAGMALKWFRDRFFDRPEEMDYDRLDALCEAVPPGCEGLVALPYLSGCPDPLSLPDATGVFYGVTLSSTRSHFARAVMEGVAYLLKDLLRSLEPLGCGTGVIRSLGGGSQSGLWQQIKADVCGKEFLSLKSGEAASAGAAWLAAKGAGLTDSLSPPLPITAKGYSPKAEHSLPYSRGYRVYRQLNDALTPLFAETEGGERS